MNFLYSKYLMSGLMMLSVSSLFGASSPIISESTPIRISPIPGPTNSDPILDNLAAVMDDFFQEPYYPGSTPDYLSDIIFSFYTYRSPGITINPMDNDYILSIFYQNRFRDRTFTFFRSNGTETLGRSTDGGLGWDYLGPIEPTISLGGTISQLVTFNPQYAKNGVVYAGGFFGDMHVNPPRLVPMSGMLFSSSNDNGLTWSQPTIIYTNTVDDAFQAADGFAFGIGQLTPDPKDVNRILGSTPGILWPSTIWGDIYYFQSLNAGKTWTSPTLVYNMTDDPVWNEQHYDAEFTEDPENYALYGGQAYNNTAPVVVDKDVILIPITRFYPKQGSTTYDQLAGTTNFDRAVVRSLDNGKTWLPVAGATDQFVFSYSHDPAGETIFDIIINDGGLQLPTVVSPFTGRVYMTYMAGNPNADPDPEVYQVFPYILLSASSDRGATWSNAVQINATPTDISFDRQQAFRPNMTITQNGYVIVAYYDFRNWTGTSGEDRFTTPLNTDAWIAIYKETASPTGGSTGVGLDFIEEIRLTPTSYNARMTLLTSEDIPGSNYNSAAICNIGLRVNNNNELYVTFGMNNPYSFDDLEPIVEGDGYRGMTIDENNRANVFLTRFKFANANNM